MTPDDRYPPLLERPPVLLALAWWATGVLLTVAILLLAAPSTQLYLGVAHTGVSWPDELATTLIIVLSASLALATWRHRRASAGRTATGLAAGVGVVIAYGVSEALKLLLAQERPCSTILPDPQCPAAGNWSFPSNHATIAFALATAIVFVVGRWWAWSAYLASLATAASRVVDGVHLPHDVLAGAILGTFTTVALTILLNRWITALIARLSQRHSPSSRALPRD